MRPTLGEVAPDPANGATEGDAVAWSRPEGAAAVGRVSRFLNAWGRRRAGSRHAPSDLGRSARHLIGPTGAGFSNAWETMARGHRAYIGSFDRRVPPSLFVSERDRSRYDQPIPLIERRIEAYRDDDGLTPEEIAWGSRPPGT